MSTETEVGTLGSTLEVSKVACKPPPFWETNPELWFTQIESQFVISGITVDNTKYHTVIASLDSKVLTCVADLVRSPPSENKYSTLKERILNSYCKSETARLKLLLQDLQLDDKRPSQLLLEMRNLAANKLADDILRSLWLQRLPLSMQQILSVSKEDLNCLAKIADKINEVSGNVSSVEISCKDVSLQSLKNEILTLKNEVSRLSRLMTRNTTRRQKSRSNSNPRSISTVLCWYHRRYAEKASKCVGKCNYSEN